MKSWTSYFKDFLRALPDGELKAECLLPSLIGELIDRGELSVSVLRSSARWFGMTYHEDKEMVQRELQKVTRRGRVPQNAARVSETNRKNLPPPDILSPEVIFMPRKDPGHAV